jgi:hypothetical protein
LYVRAGEALVRVQTLGRVVFAALAVGAVVSLCALYATVQPDGVVLVGAAITTAFERRHWRRAYASLLVSGASSLAVDGLRVWVSGRASAWLYQSGGGTLTWWRQPTPNLYVTSDGARPWSVRPGDKSFTAGRTSIVV